MSNDPLDTLTTPETTMSDTPETEPTLDTLAATLDAADAAAAPAESVSDADSLVQSAYETVATGTDTIPESTIVDVPQEEPAAEAIVTETIAPVVVEVPQDAVNAAVLAMDVSAIVADVTASTPEPGVDPEAAHTAVQTAMVDTVVATVAPPETIAILVDNVMTTLATGDEPIVATEALTDLVTTAVTDSITAAVTVGVETAITNAATPVGEFVAPEVVTDSVTVAISGAIDNALVQKDPEWSLDPVAETTITDAIKVTLTDLVTKVVDSTQTDTMEHIATIQAATDDAIAVTNSAVTVEPAVVVVDPLAPIVDDIAPTATTAPVIEDQQAAVNAAVLAIDVPAIVASVAESTPVVGVDAEAAHNFVFEAVVDTVINTVAPAEVVADLVTATTASVSDKAPDGSLDAVIADAIPAAISAAVSVGVSIAMHNTTTPEGEFVAVDKASETINDATMEAITESIANSPITTPEIAVLVIDAVTVATQDIVAAVLAIDVPAIVAEVAATTSEPGVDVEAAHAAVQAAVVDTVVNTIAPVETIDDLISTVQTNASFTDPIINAALTVAVPAAITAAVTVGVETAYQNAETPVGEFVAPEVVTENVNTAVSEAVALVLTTAIPDIDPADIALITHTVAETITGLTDGVIASTQQDTMVHVETVQIATEDAIAEITPVITSVTDTQAALTPIVDELAGIASGTITDSTLLADGEPVTAETAEAISTAVQSGIDALTPVVDDMAAVVEVTADVTANQVIVGSAVAALDVAAVIGTLPTTEAGIVDHAGAQAAVTEAVVGTITSTIAPSDTIADIIDSAIVSYTVSNPEASMIPDSVITAITTAVPAVITVATEVAVDVAMSNATATGTDGLIAPDTANASVTVAVNNVIDKAVADAEVGDTVTSVTTSITNATADMVNRIVDVIVTNPALEIAKVMYDTTETVAIINTTATADVSALTPIVNDMAATEPAAVELPIIVMGDATTAAVVAETLANTAPEDFAPVAIAIDTTIPADEVVMTDESVVAVDQPAVDTINVAETPVVDDAAMSAEVTKLMEASVTVEPAVETLVPGTAAETLGITVVHDGFVPDHDVPNVHLVDLHLEHQIILPMEAGMPPRRILDATLESTDETVATVDATGLVKRVIGTEGTAVSVIYRGYIIDELNERVDILAEVKYNVIHNPDIEIALDSNPIS